MISPWLVYFVSILDGVSILFTVLGIIGLILSAAFFIIAAYNKSEADDSFSDNRIEKYESLFSFYHKMFNRFFYASLSFLVIGAITPSTNQMAAVIIIPEIANSQASQELQKLPADLVKLAEKYVEKQLGSEEKK
jgi:hypothetical protein